jgi:hypothetical protein
VKQKQIRRARGIMACSMFIDNILLNQEAALTVCFQIASRNKQNSDACELHPFLEQMQSTPNNIEIGLSLPTEWQTIWITEQALFPKIFNWIP